LAAQMHNQSCAWEPPTGFQRHAWCEQGLAGPTPLWGRFWELEALSSQQRALFARLRGRISQELVAYGKGSDRYGLIPPDHGVLYGTGETLTYACQRVLTTHRPLHEFPRSMISKQPFMNEIGKLPDAFKASQAANFSDWRLTVDGLVTHPLSLSVSDLRALAVRSQITEVACEEGWSYIAEWIGTPLSAVLQEAGVLPQARYIVYFSIEKDWWDSIDMADALHPQTYLTWGMNDGDLPVGFGGPPVTLSDAQIADVINYVRTNFGNHYADSITSDEVSALDQKTR